MMFTAHQNLFIIIRPFVSGTAPNLSTNTNRTAIHQRETSNSGHLLFVMVVCIEKRETQQLLHFLSHIPSYNHINRFFIIIQKSSENKYIILFFYPFLSFYCRTSNKLPNIFQYFIFIFILQHNISCIGNIFYGCMSQHVSNPTSFIIFSSFAMCRYILLQHSLASVGIFLISICISVKKSYTVCLFCFPAYRCQHKLSKFSDTPFLVYTHFSGSYTIPFIYTKFLFT